MKTLTIALALMSLFAGSCTAADTNIVIEPVENGLTAGLENNDENKTEDMTNPFNFETKTVKLNSGWEMPIIGIGTYLLSTSQAEESVYNALNVGMRQIDTADIYGNEADVDRIMKIATIKPAVLQNETHPYRQSKDVKAHIAPLGTILESWFPLGGRGTGIRTLNSLDVIKEIAAAHGKSTYQVLLRWHLQSGVIAIPGSSNAKHIAEDFDIFDFSLTDEEMKMINDLERNQRFASY